MCLLRACKVMRAALAMTAFVTAGGVISLTGCHQETEDAGEKGGFVMHDTSNCLPDITLGVWSYAHCKGDHLRWGYSDWNSQPLSPGTRGQSGAGARMLLRNVTIESVLLIGARELAALLATAPPPHTVGGHPTMVI